MVNTDLLLASPVENPLDSVTDWSSQLSIGEQQRLAFARILLSNPDLLLMDESTSALDVKNEEALYKVRISNLEICDLFCVVVGEVWNLLCECWTSTYFKAISYSSFASLGTRGRKHKCTMETGISRSCQFFNKRFHLSKKLQRGIQNLQRKALSCLKLSLIICNPNRV